MRVPDEWKLLLPRPLRELPADVTAVILAVILVNGAVFLPVVQDTALRVPLGLIFVLIVPGYALIAALFPEQGRAPGADEESSIGDRGIDGIERVALSFGLSIAVVPLIGLALNFTPWGIRLTPIMLAVSGFTLLMSAVATYRRQQLPPEERFVVPYRTWIERVRAEIFEPDDRVDAALNVLLALSILLAVVVLSYAIMFPPEGERFSQFYVLTEEDDGDLVAANYPPELFVDGNPAEVVVGVDNQEHETVNYSVIILIQEVEFIELPDGNVTNVSVIDQTTLDEYDVTLAHNETDHRTVALSVDDEAFVGEDRRLQFLLYADHDTAVPATPSRDTAYRDLHLWVDVLEEE